MKKVLAIILMALVVTAVFVSCDNHKHTYSAEWKSDANSHWHECTCGAKDEEAAHSFGENTIKDGKVFQICSVCGYEKEITDAKVVATIDAFNAAIGDAKINTIVLDADITTASDEDQIEIARSVTLDLKDKNIKCGWFDVSGEDVIVTIKGTGTVTTKWEISAIENATLKLQGGTYKTGNGVWAGYWDESTCQYGNLEISGEVLVESQEGCIIVVGNSKAIINGGTFTSKDNAVIMTNGSTPCAGYEITINGGKFNGNIESSGYIACGIYIANTGTVNLNGGDFNIDGGVGVLVRSGKLNATGGTITLIAKDGLTSGRVGDSTITIATDSQLVVDDRSGYPGESPKIVSNTANFAVKDISGNDYTGV